jgi:hypothetical protein
MKREHIPSENRFVQLPNKTPYNRRRSLCDGRSFGRSQNGQALAKRVAQIDEICLVGQSNARSPSTPVAEVSSNPKRVDLKIERGLQMCLKV